jgi:hypothetical protein
MSRNLVSVLATVVALSCVVVGSTIVNIASSTGGLANVTSPQPREQTPASLTKADFEQAFASVTAPPRREDVAAFLTKRDFEQTFASVMVPRRENTPPNREKLRNIGWKRILAPA